MPKPYAPTNKKTLYGSGIPDDPKEPELIPKVCVICKKVKPSEWYELMQQGWTCDGCRPKATPIKRESQIEFHRSER